MINRSVEEDMTYYKCKVLNFIINNPGRYGLWDIENMFGLSRDKIEQLVLEYNKFGFEAYVKKGKLFIGNSKEKVEMLLKTAKTLESDLFTIYDILKEKNSGARGINIDKCLYSVFNILNNRSGLIRRLNHLERDGLVLLKEDYINILHPSFENLEDKKIIKLLIFINVVRNLYPKRNLLSSIFRKLLSEYENRGFTFNAAAVQYVNKHRMSLYEEIILNVVEDAIFFDKSLVFSYKTQVGSMNIKINPAGIIYNNQKDMWYVVTTEGRNTEYRMDKMTNVKIVDGRAGRFAGNLYEYSMGISGENLIDIKAAFKKEPHIYKKLQSYLKLRKSAAVRETNNSYILTDRVCGTNEFKKWIRSFGEDAVCLKPDKLREEMLRDVKLLKERYEVI